MKKVVIIVGHLPHKAGATNKDTGESEFEFNNKLAPMIAKELRVAGFLPIIAYRNTYSTLPSDINELNPDIGISLHCNAFNSKASGSEVLYHHSSIKGKLLAGLLQKELVKVMSESDRGVKPIDYDHIGNQGDRGGWLVEKTKAPVVISEAFFIDNLASLKKAHCRMKNLAKAYAIAVTNYFNKV